MTIEEKAKYILSRHSLSILSEIGHKLPMDEVKAIAKATGSLELDAVINCVRETADEETITPQVIYLSKVKQELEKL